MMTLKSCPFCKGSVNILVCDDEGNIHDEDGYEDNPFTIVNSFGLADLHRCGQIYNSCRFCEYFNHELNHGLCEDHEYFVWEHSVEAYKLINGDDIKHGQTETGVY